MFDERSRMVIIAVILMSIAIGYETSAYTSPLSYNTEADCRNCHGDTTVDRHHLLAANNAYNCVNCHPVNWSVENQTFYVEVIRDCLVCHAGKNHTDVHHILASQQLYYCTDCHRILFNETTQQYYTEVIWDCFTCHNSTNGFVTFPWNQNPTPTPTPSPTPTPTPNPDPNAPTGLHNSIGCSVCHQTQITEENICYQCHNNSNNSYNRINISYNFTIRNDTFSGVGSGYYDKVNTRHDISDQDQYNSSTKLECVDCHSAHNASRENITIDPDDRSNFNKTMIHPGTKETVTDSVTFCLKCHDNTWSPNVTGPSVIKNIITAYMDASNKGDEHGAASGRNNSRLIGPYNGTPSSKVPPMPCTDCHDPHGGKGIYHLKTLNDQYGKPITITSYNVKNHIVAHWCSSCHFNPMNQLDGNRGNCLKSGCHIHGKKF